MTYRAPVGLYSPIYIIFLLFRLAHNELYFKLPVYVCADRTCFLLNNNTSKNLNLCICTKIIMQYYTAPVTWSSYWKGKSSESTMAALHIVTGNWYTTQPKNCIATALGCMECTGKRAACVNNAAYVWQLHERQNLHWCCSMFSECTCTANVINKHDWKIIIHSSGTEADTLIINGSWFFLLAVTFVKCLY